MGRAILIKDGIKADDTLNAQTIQAASANGTASDAKGVNMASPLATVNQPQLVSSSTTNAPSDLTWGVKTVYRYSATSGMIVIKGVNNSGIAAEWDAIITVANNTTTVGAWTSVLASTRISELESTVDDLIDRVNDITNVLMIQAGILNGEDLN